MAQVLYNVVVVIPGGETDNRAVWGYTVLVHDLAPTIKVEDIIEMGACVGPVLEVRLFMKEQKAHVRFTKIEDAIKFIELFNKRTYRTGRGRLEFRPLMSPSSDYPCLKVSGLPDNITEQVLFDAIQSHAPRLELTRVLRIIENQAVVQFASQRTANNMMNYARRVPLRLRGTALRFQWEGTPVARVNQTKGFADKEKLAAAFNVIEGNHVLGVALLQDRAYVYFDFRFNLEAAAAIVGEQVRIQMDDGTMKVFSYLLL